MKSILTNEEMALLVDNLNKKEIEWKDIIYELERIRKATRIHQAQIERNIEKS